MKDPRDLLALEVVELSNTHKAMLLNHSTGVGKTLTSLKISETTVNNKHLIVHAETTHKDNILADIIKFGYDPENYVFKTYRGLKQEAGNSYGCIILDEAHRITSLNSTSLRKIICEKFIALSAEVPSPKLQLLQLLAPKLYTHKVDLKLAIELGILPTPKIKLHWLDLDNEIRKEVVLSNLSKTGNSKYVKSFEEYMFFMDGPGKWVFTIKAYLTDKEHYDYINNLYANYDNKIKELYNEIVKKNQEIRLNPSLRYVYDINGLYEEQSKIRRIKKLLGGRRKNFVCDTKNDYVNTLFHSLKGKKIAFTNSIASATSLSKNHIHSKVKDKKLVTRRISDFKEGIINELSCSNMMKESHNIPDLKHVILQQMDISTFIGFIQVRGRALRSDKTILHLILQSNTIDTEIIKQLQENKLL